MTQQSTSRGASANASSVLRPSVRRFEEIAALDEATRREVLLDLIYDEFGGEEQRRDLTAVRLAAWLKISRSDMKAAQKLGRSYEAVFARLPVAMSSRRETVLQGVNGYFRDEDRLRLFEIVPGMSRSVSADSNGWLGGI